VAREIGFSEDDAKYRQKPNIWRRTACFSANAVRTTRSPLLPHPCDPCTPAVLPPKGKRRKDFHLPALILLQLISLG